MKHETIKILFIGDIFGDAGLYAISNYFPLFIEKYQPDFVVGNAENADQGKGLTEEIAEQLFSAGFDALTTGNHIWDNWKSRPLLATNQKVLRPLNYPSGNPGKGYSIYQVNDNLPIAVINLQGRTFMQTIDCPFRSADKALADLQEKAKIIVVDFHAEATAEKITLARYLDGRVSAVIGTHTHIQTSDERIFPNGTAYISDVGMTGPYDSVLGMKYEVALKRFMLQTPHKFFPATADVHLAGVFFEVNPNDGKCSSIEKIFYPKFKRKQTAEEVI